MSAVCVSSSQQQLKVSRLWPLEKYARLLQEKEKQPSLRTQHPHANSWKVKNECAMPVCSQFLSFLLQHFNSTSESTIQMSLLEGNHLMISNGNQIYVST